MVVKQQEDFARALVTGGATASQIIRALQDIPGDAILTDIEIEYDFTNIEPFPVAFKASFEWVKQPDEADILPEGGAS